MGQIKHKMGNVGGGIDISHKSKMSGKAKSLMSFTNGMPGPNAYGKAEGMPKIVGKGMAKFISGESVGMRKMGQHKAPPQYDDGPMRTEGKKGGLKTAKMLKAKQEKEKLDKELERGPSGRLYASSVPREQRIEELGLQSAGPMDPSKKDSKLKNKAIKKKKETRKALRTISTVTGKILSSRDKKEIGTQYSGGAKKSAGPMDPSKKDSKLKKGAVVSGDKSKVSKKVTGMTAEEKKAELLYRRNLKKAINKSKRDTQKDVRANLTQVQKDRQANLKVQRQRQKAGQDYVKYKKGTSTTAKGHSDEKGKKTGFEGGGGSNEGVVVRKKLKK